MYSINPSTKIAKILKVCPEALEAIISITPGFEKLRNPVLRKIMAGRVSLSMASKIGGCTVNDFYEKLLPFGFTADENISNDPEADTNKVPSFIINLKKKEIVELNVIPIIKSGDDPLSLILKIIKGIKPGQTLKIINTFAPTPLIHLLNKKGFESYTEKINEELIYTYFHAPEQLSESDPTPKISGDKWEEMLALYEGRTQKIDVRNLEMPLPMHKILEELSTLPADEALFVYHKRIPVFLLPELSDRNFEYQIKEIAEDEVYLLIYKGK